MHPHELPTVSIADLPAELTGVTLLDVREDDEWRAGHAANALHVPMNLLPNRLNHEPELLDREARVLVVCRSGGRSAQVTAWLVQHGFDAVNLAGGMHAWDAAGRPMVAEGAQAPFVL